MLNAQTDAATYWQGEFIVSIFKGIHFIWCRYISVFKRSQLMRTHSGLLSPWLLDWQLIPYANNYWNMFTPAEKFKRLVVAHSSTWCYTVNLHHQSPALSIVARHWLLLRWNMDIRVLSRMTLVQNIITCFMTKESHSGTCKINLPWAVWEICFCFRCLEVWNSRCSNKMSRCHLMVTHSVWRWY